MSGRFLRSEWRLVESGLVALLLLIVAGPVWAQEPSSTSSAADQTRNAGPIVRTFGTEGGYRTEVTTQSFSKLNEEDRRQASLLMAEVVQHIGKARDASDAADAKQALKEVNKAREAAKAIRAMLPKGTSTHPDDRARRQGDIRGRTESSGGTHPPVRGNPARPDPGTDPGSPS